MPSKVVISDTYQLVVVGTAYLVKGLLYRLRVKAIIDQVLPYQPDIETTYGALAQIVIANRMTFQPAPVYKLGPWAAFATYAAVIVRGQRGREKLWHLSTLDPLQKKIWDILGLPALQTLAEGQRKIGSYVCLRISAWPWRSWLSSSA